VGEWEWRRRRSGMGEIGWDERVSGRSGVMGVKVGKRRRWG
jgi:hypothetical protein